MCLVDCVRVRVLWFMLCVVLHVVRHSSMHAHTRSLQVIKHFVFIEAVVTLQVGVFNDTIELMEEVTTGWDATAGGMHVLGRGGECCVARCAGPLLLHCIACHVMSCDADADALLGCHDET